MSLAPAPVDLPDSLTMTDIDFDLEVPCGWSDECTHPAEWKCRAIHEGEENSCATFFACTRHRDRVHRVPQKCRAHQLPVVIDSVKI